MKKTIVFLFLLGGITRVTAQGIVHIEDIENNVRDMPMIFKFKLPLWELNLNPYNSSLYDFNVGASILQKKFFLSADFSYSLLDRVIPDSYERDGIAGNTVTQLIMFPVNKSTPANHIQLEGTYFFNEQIKEKPIKIVLRAGRNYEHYTMVDGEQLNRWGARIGFTRGITWYAFNNGHKTIYGENVKDGTLTGFDYNWMSTIRNYSNLNIGISFSKTTNMKVWVREFGKRSNSGVEFFYGDMLLALKNQMDNVFSAVYYDGTRGNMYYQEFNLNNTNKKSKVGLRLGYRAIPFRGIFGYNFEAGITPGFKAARNFFFKIGFSLYFGNKPG